jgi:hypothetical protein
VVCGAGCQVNGGRAGLLDAQTDRQTDRHQRGEGTAITGGYVRGNKAGARPDRSLPPTWVMCVL